MKRLIRKASAVTYTATSPVKITIMNDSDSWEDSIDSNFSELQEAVKNDMQEMGPKGLAEYLGGQGGERAELVNIVESIIVDVKMSGNNVQAITTISCNRELSNDEKEVLKDYISGQFSDGWGEGFEQNEFAEWDDKVEESYEDEDGNMDYDYVTQKHRMYASFYNSKNFSITLK